MRNAIIAIEDRRFYDELRRRPARHRPRVRPGRRSAAAAQGGSTITQQFVKNALRAQSERTVFQKLREAALAYHLTRKWSKSKILTEYLNSIYFGNGAYGIESAARTYFGKQPDHQGCGTRARPVRQGAQARGGGAASPASSPTPAPTTPSPTRRRPRAAQPRAQGHVRAGPARRAREYAQRARRGAAGAASTSSRRPCETKAPYFTTWVRQQLVDRYGARRAFEGGLRVATTLDLELQDAAEKAVNAYLPNADGPTAARRRHRQPDRRGAGDGRRPRLRHAAVQPRHPGPAPARLGVQAVHPRRGAERGHRAGLVWPSRKRVFTVPGTKGAREVRGQQLREQLRGLADARRRPHLLRQLRLRGGRHPGRARRRSRAWRGGWASARRSPRTTR